VAGVGGDERGGGGGGRGQPGGEAGEAVGGEEFFVVVGESGGDVEASAVGQKDGGFFEAGRAEAKEFHGVRKRV
jgi:hypothetical protein